MGSGHRNRNSDSVHYSTNSAFKKAPSSLKSPLQPQLSVMANLKPNLPHVAIVSSPGMGHLIPLLELAKRLVTHHCLEATLIMPTLSSLPQALISLLQNLPSSISYAILPPPDMTDLSLQSSKVETLVALTITRSLHLIRQEFSLIASSGRRLAAVVADFFSVDSFEFANEFNAAPFLFFPSGAVILHSLFQLPKLDEMEKLDDLLQFPGCIPIPQRDFGDAVLDRTHEAYNLILHIAQQFHRAAGVMLNSFLELENESITAFQNPNSGTPPVYSVGPLINMDGITDGSEPDCLEWLANQPHGSVLYVSFGSGGTLTFEQITELAMGLEMSKVRFLWVVRSPSDGAGNAAYFTVHSETDPFYFLPEGFINRTKGRGVMVDSWAPQMEILRHGSTGGFLTHCGWNSVLESVVNGVPIIAWPLCADQKMNAHVLSQGVGIALRPRGSSETGVVGREEICDVVMKLMEGDEGKNIKERMNHLKGSAAEALSKDGSSYRSLAQVVSQFRSF